MLTNIKPDFMNSPYFVDEPGNWHLKEGAPNELVEAFRRYMDTLNDENVPGAIYGNHISFPSEE